jgi:RNA polymerase sigma-70 factor (ECF subfamily)
VSTAAAGPALLAEALAGARPRAVGALLRFVRDLDAAEDAFQEAALRALKSWPEAGLPRDPAAWLILVGRNLVIDRARRRARQAPLPPEELLSDLEDAEAALADRLDEERWRDDVLRLLFTCCHPELAAEHQVALALRVVSGLGVRQIARAFLVSEAAMEQRLTRAKARIAAAGLPFAAPGPAERIHRRDAVAAMVYLLFNEGYSAGGGPGSPRAQLCGEAIRLARLLLELFPGDPELLGLCALCLLQHARAAARFAPDGAIILLDRQDRGLWSRPMIAEGLALLEEAARRQQPGPYQLQAAVAALHARAARPEDTAWAEIERLYAALERLQPSPVITLNRAVALAKAQGPAAALALIDPLGERLSGYFPYHGVKGALLKDLGRRDEARAALERAAALANTPAEAAHIREQIAELGG